LGSGSRVAILRYFIKRGGAGCRRGPAPGDSFTGCRNSDCSTAATAQIQRAVSRHSDFDTDFLFAELCLAGEARALAELHDGRAGAVRGFLQGAGVRTEDAEEVVRDLVADLLVPRGLMRPLLASYRGDCQLATWLNRIALNNVLLRRRAEERRQRREGVVAEAVPQEEAPVQRDDALRELLLTAVQNAFGVCSPEDFVLLHLLHAGELRIGELSRMFGRDPKTINAHAERSAADVRFAITTEIERRDPWLKLSYEEIIDLLRPDLPELFERRTS